MYGITLECINYQEQFVIIAASVESKLAGNSKLVNIHSFTDPESIYHLRKSFFEYKGFYMNDNGSAKVGMAE